MPEKPAMSKNPNSWWTPDLERIRRETKVLERWHLNGSESHACYAEKRREYSKAIENAKRQSWQNICTQTEGAKDIARLVKSLDNNVSCNVSLFSEASVPLSPEETLNNLLWAHFLEGVIDGGKLSPVSPLEADFTGIVQFVSTQMVEAAICSFGDMKAPGPDGFVPIVLKNLPCHYLKWLVNIYKVSLAMGVTPGYGRR